MDYSPPGSCVHGILQARTEKAMAPHSSTLAWRITWMEEPGRPQSKGTQKVRHDWATSLSLFTFMHWRRKWQPSPVFLPGESQRRGILVGCPLWDQIESNTTEVTCYFLVNPKIKLNWNILNFIVLMANWCVSISCFSPYIFSTDL